MKALSLSQPMAWALVVGLKPIENRPRNTSFRGRCYIHASQTFNQEHYEFILKLGIQPPIDELDFGCLVGEADVVSVVKFHDSEWFTGPNGLVVRNAIKYDKPIKCKGTIFPLFFEPVFNPQ